MRFPQDSTKAKSLDLTITETASNPLNFGSVHNQIPTNTLESLKQKFVVQQASGIVCNSNKVYLSTLELSERWPVSKRTLENWRQRGIGPQWTKFGSRVAYHIDEVLAYESAHFFRGRAS